MNNIVRYIFQFFILVFIQIFIVDKIQLGSLSSHITPFIYVLFFLTLPFNLQGWMSLLLAFLCGFTLDVFYGTLGMHTSSLLVVGYFRPYLSKLIEPRDGFDFTKQPSVYSLGLSRFVGYVSMHVLLFHVWFFTVERLRFSDFHVVVLNAVLSSVFALLLILLLQYLLVKK